LNINKKRVIDIVIPVFNNEASLVELHSRLLQIRSKLNEELIDTNFIFVEDGSSDQSLKTLRSLAEKSSSTTLIKHSRNFGAREALKIGIAHSKGDATVMLAADLQEPPEIILDLVSSWILGNKFVIAKRISRDDPILSKIFSKLFNIIIRRFVLKEFPQGGFDTALFDRQLRPYLVKSSKSSYAPVLLIWLGFKPKVIEVKRSARPHGKSGWSFSRKVDLLIDIMVDNSHRLMSHVIVLALLTSFFSLLLGVATLIANLMGNVKVEGYTTLFCAIVFLFSLTILLVSLCGEYLIRIMRENNKRPESVVESVEEFTYSKLATQKISEPYGLKTSDN
jgi:glycosyltransferase involved in cell wall biosynthesis